MLTIGLIAKIHKANGGKNHKGSKIVAPNHSVCEVIGLPTIGLAHFRYSTIHESAGYLFIPSIFIPSKDQKKISSSAMTRDSSTRRADWRSFNLAGER